MKEIYTHFCSNADFIEEEKSLLFAEYLSKILGKASFAMRPRRRHSALASSPGVAILLCREAQTCAGHSGPVHRVFRPVALGEDRRDMVHGIKTHNNA
jgi:hypothetical protein